MKILKNSFHLYRYALHSERQGRAVLVFFVLTAALCGIYIYPFISTAFLNSSVGSYLVEKKEVKTTSVADVIKKDIFGTATAPVNSKARTPINNSIALTLKGVLRHKDPRKSRAIIAAAGGAAKTYTAGDMLPGNVTLEAIDDISITILKNGASVTIPIKK
jgi:type II secretory pathway component PulC